MCIIVPIVEQVSDTNLFARLTENGQILVYQMNFTAEQAVAMILPIPVALPAHENAVRFINLKGYPEFFVDCNFGFPNMWNARGTYSLGAAPQSLLRVEDVGDFEASFVPTVFDFQRVDPRFRLPEGTFEKLPEYHDYGFVVFQFKETGGTPHPMAFEFPTRLLGTLFYPTVHIHDGKIHDQEHFDHTLYLQGESKQGVESIVKAGQFLRIKKTQGIVIGGAPLRRIQLKGMLPNTDTMVEVTSSQRE